MSELVVNKLAQDVLAVLVKDTDFYCRVWAYQKDRINDFFNASISKKDTMALTFSECIFDVDGHYCDLVIKWLDSETVTLHWTDSDNQGTIAELVQTEKSKLIKEKLSF